MQWDAGALLFIEILQNVRSLAACVSSRRLVLSGPAAGCRARLLQRSSAVLARFWVYLASGRRRGFGISPRDSPDTCVARSWPSQQGASLCGPTSPAAAPGCRTARLWRSGRSTGAPKTWLAEDWRYDIDIIPRRPLDGPPSTHRCLVWYYYEEACDMKVSVSGKRGAWQSSVSRVTICPCCWAVICSRQCVLSLLILPS